jgi:tape measure domain-containing protein
MTGKEAARLFVTVGADTSSFQTGMRQVQGSLNQTAGAVNGTMGMFKQFALGQIVGTYALQALNGALGFAKDSIIGFNATLEQAEIGFETMLGSAEAATKMLTDLKKFAAATPFEFTGLLDSSKRLMAMGFEAEKIIPVMTTVGDAVAGLGAGSVGIDRATYALGQMHTAGRINAQDMMQLTSLGIPSWRYLSEAIGVTTAEVRKMSEQGLIPAELGIAAILAGMEKDFGGMMSKQATTFTGAMSNINDMMQQIVGEGFKPFFTEVSKAALAMATFLQSSSGFKVMNDLKSIVQQVVDVIKTIVPIVFGVIGAFAGFIAANPIILQVVGALIGLRIALVGLSIITGVISMIRTLASVMGAVRAAFLVGGAVQGFTILMTALAPTLVAATAGFSGAAAAVGAFTIALLANPITWIVLAVVGVTAAIVTLGGAFDETGEQAKRSAEMTTDSWKDTHSYLTSYNATAPRDAQAGGAAYGAAYAAGVTGTGPAQYAAGAYISTQAATGMAAEGVPAAAAAGQVVGATFGKEMQSAAMVSFRAGERDISGVMTDNVSAADKALAEALAAWNTGNVNAAFNKKMSEAFSIKPGVLRTALQAGLGGLSGGLLDIANGAIKDIYRAQVNKRFANSLKPKGKAIYEGFVDLKTEMVRGAQEAVLAAKNKLDGFKGVLSDLKNKMKSYAEDIKQSLLSGLSLKNINMREEFDEFSAQVISSVTTFKDGVAKTVANISMKPMLKDANYVVDQFKQRVEKMKSFITNLQNLKKAGLNSAVLKDILGMGVEEGGAMAAALSEGGKASVDQINALQAQADAMAGVFGNMMGQMEFGAQIGKAEQDVKKGQKALQREQSALDEAVAFDPIKATEDALAALKRGTGANTRTRTGTSTNTNNNNNASVTVSNLNITMPTVAGYGTGEQAMERANAARIAAEVAKALSQITMTANRGYILK